ncbi:MAG: hypothetical protein QM627_05175 [Luteolibacter sp.]
MDPAPKKTAQKLLKMSAVDAVNLELMTLGAMEVYRKKYPNALPHELPSTSHVLRVLIRRASQEVMEKRDSGLMDLFAFHGGMWEEKPVGGYFPPLPPAP